MKVYGAKVIKEGVKDGRSWQMIGFKDERGRSLTTFDELVLDAADGSDIDGAVSEVQKGDQTYYNFKMSKEQSKPIQTAAVKPAEKAPTVPQEVWEKKDRAMAWMNCNNAAAQLFSGTGLMKEHIEHLTKLFDQYERDINGKKSLSENFAKVIEQVPPTPPVPVDEQPPAEIDLDDIPF